MERHRSVVGRCWRGVLAVVIAMPIAAAVSTAPVAADCGSDGIEWPSEPADVRGVTFIGTVLGEASDDPATGPTLVRFAVDELIDGTAGAEVWLEPWCVAPRFGLGERYLVSSSDQLPLGSAPSPTDGHVWFTDPYAVAWHLPGAGKAVLMGYGDGSLRDAPAWLTRARSREQAVAAVLPDPASPVPAVTDTVEDETFRLTIATDRPTYTTAEVIPVAATLTMLRSEPTTIVGSGSGPVLFGVEQLDGPVDVGPFATADCAYHVWAPGETEFVPFVKSGGYDAEDPMAPFWIGFFNDADLVLPAGRFRIFAQVGYDIDACSGTSTELEAEVFVEVFDGAAATGPR